MAHLLRIRPSLVVGDMEATLRYWTEQLGFTVGASLATEGQPPYWANVVRDDVMVMFQWEAEHTHDDGEVHTSQPGLEGGLYLNVDDADAVRAELVQTGALPADAPPPVDQPWGMREVTVTDPNGFVLVFGQATGDD